MSGGVLRFIALTALVGGLGALAPAAQGRSAASLKLEVAFTFTGDIVVTLADGTPVGTTKGDPTVIPAGFYKITLTQPGCIDVPDFDLQGPGVKILDNLDVGEDMTKDFGAVFQPNSTYTWRNDSTTPVVVHTFVTSADIVGTAPAPGTPLEGFNPPPVTSTKTQSNGDVVGSAIAPFRGTLTGGVSAAGRLTLAFKGKSVTSLSAGRYTITVVDRSGTNGFMAEKNSRTVSVTGAAFVGKHSATVVLTAGRWVFTSRHGTTTYSVVVR